jgi:hypothetical protein
VRLWPVLVVLGVLALTATPGFAQSREEAATWASQAVEPGASEVPTSWWARFRARRALEREQARRIEAAHHRRPTPDDRVRDTLTNASVGAGVAGGLAGVVGLAVFWGTSSRGSFPSGGGLAGGLLVAAGGGGVLALGLGLGLTSLTYGPHRELEPDAGQITAFYVVASLLAAAATGFVIQAVVAHTDAPRNDLYLVGVIGSGFLVPLAGGMGIGVTARHASALGETRAGTRVTAHVGVGSFSLVW